MSYLGHQGFQQIPMNAKIQDIVHPVCDCFTSAGGLPGVSGYQGCLPAHPDLSASPTVSKVYCGDIVALPFWPIHCSQSVHKDVGSDSGVFENLGYPPFWGFMDNLLLQEQLDQALSSNISGAGSGAVSLSTEHSKISLG